MLTKEQVQQIKDFLALKEEPDKDILELIELQLKEGTSLEELLNPNSQTSLSNSDFY
ncbi:MAG: hypothetical protein VKL42_08900 [Snowella sp.]|nr:hypothetical protein [Snowella sp.]